MILQWAQCHDVESDWGGGGGGGTGGRGGGAGGVCQSKIVASGSCARPTISTYLIN